MAQGYEDDGRPIFGCPLRRVEPWAMQMLAYYPAFQKNILLKQGGLEDQPYPYLWAMSVIESEVGVIEKERAEADKRKADAAARRKHR